MKHIIETVMKLLIKPGRLFCRLPRLGYSFAVVFGKAYFCVHKLLNMDITAYPGWYVRQMFPDFIQRQAEKLPLLLILGTNGKTSTTRILVHTLEENGISCAYSPYGANLVNGIASVFLQFCNWRGDYTVNYAVLECDEKTFPEIAPELQGCNVTLLITNVFPDQLDRYGSPDEVLGFLQEGIKLLPQATLVLNADCPLMPVLGRPGSGRVFYYGMSFDDSCGHKETSLKHVGQRCPICGKQLLYHPESYGKMGDYHCDSCGYHRPVPEYTQILMKELPAYKQYNLLAVTAALAVIGHPLSVDFSAFESVKNPGRCEHFSLAGTEVVLFLTKNSVGYQQTFRELPEKLHDCAVIFAVNDQEADGKDPSWLWSCDFEPLLSKMTKSTVLCSCGKRAFEVALRLKYEDVDPGQILVCHEFEELLLKLENHVSAIYIFANYTILTKIRACLLNEGKEE